MAALNEDLLAHLPNSSEANFALLERLCNAPGVSGHEDKVREILMDEVRPYADSIHVDSIGNLYVTKGSDKREVGLMLTAHMDEVGLMVEKVDDEGFIRFLPVGGVDARILPAKRVRVGKDAIPGVIGAVPPHFEAADKAKKVTPVSELRIDAGASSKAEMERFVEPGDPVWFDTSFERFDGNLLKGKAFDDRAGCFILAELAKQKFDCPVTLVWTTQEEVGLRGARLASTRVKPEILLAVEGTGAGDAPQEGDVARTPFLGKGSVVTILDRSLVANQKLAKFITKTADSEGLPWQYKRPLIGSTDASAGVRTKAMAAAVVAVPARYIHSPVALAHVEDIINTMELLRSVTRKIKGVKL